MTATEDELQISCRAAQDAGLSATEWLADIGIEVPWHRLSWAAAWRIASAARAAAEEVEIEEASLASDESLPR